MVPLCGKRFSGWLSWQLRRKRRHRSHVLDALVADVAQEAPDHVVVTGDLTNVALASEFIEARTWLERLGTPANVTAVPGNHDAYVAVPEAQGIGLWTDYLESDAAGAAFRAEHCGIDKESALTFPTLNFAGRVAIVGLSSAQPTGWFQAHGTLGETQRAHTEVLLRTLGDAGHARVLLLHHPPVPGLVSDRRALRDAAAFCEVITRVGAELVLHGHLHRTRFHEIHTAVGHVPVVGVRSASDVGHEPEKCAAYHLYDIDLADRSAPLRVRTRIFEPQSGTFASGGSRALPR